jgi:hypothetical protein
VHPRKCVTKVHNDRPHLLDSEPLRTARAVEMVDICHTSSVGGCGTVAALNFNSICPATWSVIILCLFLSTTSRGPCVPLASGVPKLPRSPPGGVTWRNPRPVGVWPVCCTGTSFEGNAAHLFIMPCSARLPLGKASRMPMPNCARVWPFLNTPSP